MSQDRFTLVFEGDLRKFVGNPFLTDTAFGRPLVAEIGDAGAERDALVDVLQACIEWMDLREKKGAGERITDRARAALDEVQADCTPQEDGVVSDDA